MSGSSTTSLATSTSSSSSAVSGDTVTVADWVERTAYDADSMGSSGRASSKVVPL